MGIKKCYNGDRWIKFKKIIYIYIIERGEDIVKIYKFNFDHLLLFYDQNLFLLLDVPMYYLIYCVYTYMM